MIIRSLASSLGAPLTALIFVRHCGASRTSMGAMLGLLAGKAGIDAVAALILAAVLALLLPVGRAAGGWYVYLEAFSYGPLSGVMSPLLLLVVMLVLCKAILMPLLLWARGALIDRWTLLVSMSVLQRQLLQGLRQRSGIHAQDSNVAVNFLVPRIVMGSILPSLDLLSEAIVVGVLLSVLMMLEPVATSMLIAALLIAVGVGKGLSRLLLDQHADLKPRLQTLLQRWVTDSVACLREIRLYRRVPAVLERYRPVATGYSRESARERLFMDIQSPVIELFFLLALGAAVLVASERAWQADFHLLALFSAVGLRLILGFRRISSSLQTMRFARPVFDRINSAVPEPIEKPLVQLEYSAVDSADLLVCESLHYCYDGASQDVIHGLELVLRKAEWVGLAGESGVGKSTLVDLLIGELQPHQGSIRWFTSDAQHAGIGYASSTTTLIPGTLRDNVAFLDEQCSDSVLREALAIAEIEPLLERLPDGLDTPVDVFEQRISSGERQRIGLARALLQARSLLILDEATAALDPATESRFLQGVRAARPDLAVLLITHRLSTLSHTERNLLMDNGALNVFIPDSTTGLAGQNSTCM